MQEESFGKSRAAAWHVKTDETRTHTHTNTRAHTEVSLRGFDALLWFWLILKQEGYIWAPSWQRDGVDSFRWAENADFPGGEMWLKPTSERQGLLN